MDQDRKIDASQIDYLANFSASLTIEDIPQTVLAATKRFIADTCAVAIAGRVAPSCQTVIDTAKKWDGGATGSSSIIGDQRTVLTPGNAAFVNGYKAHCLEWDALHEEGVAIAFCTPVGALLAECNHQQVYGSRFLTAITAAAEFFILLGLTSGSTAQFFRPSAAGTISAAIAVAHIRGYSVEKTKSTIGHAYSLAAGTMQAHWEGVATLAMQVGTASKNAIYAADLAEAGMAAPVDIFTGRFGFFSIFEAPGTFGERFSELGKIWRLREVAYKPFPCGRATQGVLTILREIRTTQTLAADDIKSVGVSAPPLISVLVNRPLQDDMSPSYARLCLPYVLALYVLYDEIDPRRFTNSIQPTAQEKEVAAKLRISVREDLPGNILTPIDVTIERTDGTTQTNTCNHAWGAPASSFCDADLKEKISKCLTLGELQGDGGDFLDTFLEFEKVSDSGEIIRQLYS